MQALLPIYPVDLTPINEHVGVRMDGSTVEYLHCVLPLFQHHKDDHASFRWITSQLIVGGTISQKEVRETFGISAISVKRSVKVFREEGGEGFFFFIRRRGAAVLTSKVLEKAQSLLDQGRTPSEVARELGLKADTLRKAVKAGKLKKGFKKYSRREIRENQK